MYRKCQQVCALQVHINQFSYQSWLVCLHEEKGAIQGSIISKNPSDSMVCKQVQKDSQNTFGTAHYDYFQNMVISKPSSKNKKLFYVKGMKCDSLGVATLKREGTNYSEASEKADIMNIQFASAITREYCTKMFTIRKLFIPL